MTPGYESAAVTRLVRGIMDSEGSPLLDGFGGVYHWSWDESTVMARFQPPCPWEWLNRLAELERRGQCGLTMYAGPGDDWEDEAEDEHGERHITAGGIVELCCWYGQAVDV
jgi:hypothetical protein